MKRISDDIKSGNIKKLYLIYGDEAYLRKQYKDMLKKAIVGDDDMNFNYYEGKDINIPSVIDQAETMPFFAEKRLILIENSGLLKSGGEMLDDYLKDIPQTTYFVIVENEVDKRSKLFKTCQGIGVAVEMKTPDLPMLKKWINKSFVDQEKKITERDIEYLIETVGDDMVNLKNEINKLVSYAGQRQIINSEDIDAICIRLVSNHVFDMVEAIGNRDLDKALKLYYELLTLKEPPFRILSLIVRQFNILLQTRELMINNVPGRVISEKIKVPPFFVNKYINQAREFDMPTLKNALEKCIKTDEDIKMGRMSDRLSVELLIVELGQS